MKNQYEEKEDGVFLEILANMLMAIAIATIVLVLVGISIKMVLQ